jgi:hypothetical protein
MLLPRLMYRVLVDTTKRRDGCLEGRQARSDSIGREECGNDFGRYRCPRNSVFFFGDSHDILYLRVLSVTTTTWSRPAIALSAVADSWVHSLINFAVARCVLDLANEEVTEHLEPL